MPLDEHGKMHQSQEDVEKANREIHDNSFIGAFKGIGGFVLAGAVLFLICLQGYICRWKYRLYSCQRPAQRCNASCVFSIQLGF